MTAQVTGEIVTLIGALEQGVYDAGGLALLSLVGPTYEDEAFPPDRLYRTFTRNGVAVLYKGAEGAQAASSVFTYIVPQDDADAYPTPDQLIDGLPLSTATREAVVAHFGEPLRSGAAFDVFAVNDRFVNFRYGENGELTLVTVMVTVPGV